jgi:hypothetical protein
LQDCDKETLNVMMKIIVLLSILPLFLCSASKIEVENQYMIRLNVDNLDGDYNHHRSALKEHIKEMKVQLGDSKFNVLSIYDHLVSVPCIKESEVACPLPPHYAARISPDSVEYVKSHPTVFRLEQDALVSIAKCVEEKKPDWGLTRVNQRGGFDYDSYFYETQNWGQNVNAYVLGEKSI